jgi:hypothetical protein
VIGKSWKNAEIIEVWPGLSRQRRNHGFQTATSGPCLGHFVCLPQAASNQADHPPEFYLALRIFEPALTRRRLLFTALDRSAAEDGPRSNGDRAMSASDRTDVYTRITAEIV